MASAPADCPRERHATKRVTADVRVLTTTVAPASRAGSNLSVFIGNQRNAYKNLQEFTGIYSINLYLCLQTFSGETLP